MGTIKISDIHKMKTGVRKTQIDSELIKMYVNNLTDVTPENCQTFRKYGISQQIVFENMEDLQKAYYGFVKRVNYKHKTNNWLKMHREPMRRKPFKKESKYTFLDESYVFLGTKDEKQEEYVRDMVDY